MGENLFSGLANNKGADQPAQADLRLCYSLIRKYHILTCCKRNFNFLAGLCSSGGWIEYDLVGNAKDRFSHVEDHIMHVHNNQ